MNPETQHEPSSLPDQDLTRIVKEEERCLNQVLEHLETKPSQPPPSLAVDYDSEMVALRDQIASARLEDIPPLVQELSRIQSLAGRKRETARGAVDPRSPYFGRLVLEEGGRSREVLIGRTTYLDTSAGIRIVDWRDAPVSRIYYRYEEGDEYDETFGDREISGRVATRRALTITERTLRRIVGPQGSFVRRRNGEWKRLDDASARLSGGQGAAPRPNARASGKLGTGADDGSDDRHLREITALIDARQFELITKPDSGLVVIQGGAGSGKTTIGLHRMAYLAFQDPRRFRPDRMLVIVFNDALARYIAQVLPSLGVEGIAIRTYEDWASRARIAHLPRLPERYSETTPSEVTRLKKHPAMLKAIDAHVAAMAANIERGLGEALERGQSAEAGAELLAGWVSEPARPLYHRLHGLRNGLAELQHSLSTDARVAIERLVRDGLTQARDIVGAWADLLTDRTALRRVFDEHAHGEFGAAELDRAHAWCHARCLEVHAEIERRAEERALEADKPERPAKKRRHDEFDADADDDDGPTHGVDGAAVDDHATLDREDDALLLRLIQRMLGPLRRGVKAKEAMIYEHVFVDEAQDLSPVELAVVLDTVSRARSVTLAGDTAQKLLMDNGFSDWNVVLGQLGLDHVAVEPLRLSYRSSKPIIEFAREVLGPLAPEDAPRAIRDGAPVELFEFAHTGDAVGFLSEALRELMTAEPRASVAVIARYPEHADLFYDGLKTAEIPQLRRIVDQEFPFRPGVDVTDSRQVKGLEFDYVVLVEASEATYPVDEESRHLLHIAATRAAHQLWVLCAGRPSQLLPERLREERL